MSPLSGLGSGEISDVLMAGRWRICPRLKAGKLEAIVRQNSLVNTKYPSIGTYQCIKSMYGVCRIKTVYGT